MASKRLYEERKKNGLCPYCGRKRDRDGIYCEACLVKDRERQRKTREFYRKHHLCILCGKHKTYGNDKLCYECWAKGIERNHNATEEQKARWRENMKIAQKKQYHRRIEEGICTRCGKMKAIEGKRKCAVCLSKDAEAHRRRQEGKVSAREYRMENHLCLFCAKPIDRPNGNICNACYEKFSANGKRNASNNKYWQHDNKIAFNKH